MSYTWIKWKKGGRWQDNDEGYNYQHCSRCGKTTEHDMSSCIPCADRGPSIIRHKVGEHTISTYPNGKSYCSCKGFKYRKTCKHVQ